MTEIESIIWVMSPIELAMYRDMGGALPPLLDRLAKAARDADQSPLPLTTAEKIEVVREAMQEHFDTAPAPPPRRCIRYYGGVRHVLCDGCKSMQPEREFKLISGCRWDRLCRWCKSRQGRRAHAS